MNENQTLEMQILAKSEEAIKSLDKLINKLTGVEQIVNKVDKTLNKGTVKKTSENINNLKNSTDKTTKSVEKLDKALSLSGAYLGMKRITTTFLQWMDLAVDRTEQLNLFNVVFKNVEKNGVKTFSTLGREATVFQNKMNEAFGTNMTETLKYQGLFQSMGENVGIPDNYAALMSETMTKLTYDLASLYNKSESTTGEALRAGVYAGQTKPLRSYGIDVTQNSMQPILNKLGITDRSIKQMSQAEKEILRYLTTLEQAKIAMGDFANTIESPANQMKIFKQQLVETKVAVTSLFMGTFANILPYANAFLMVIKEISKSIAAMFGINLSDFNTGIASSEDAYVDLEDSVNDATDAVKELKRQTLGFDQINNINENKNSGNAVSVSGGVDKRLLDAIKGYDNGMEQVRMKATEIRDRIMEWLGFTKQINPLTGEIDFKYQGWKKTLKNIVSSFLKLNTQGKIFVSLGLITLFSGLFNTINKLSKKMGVSGLLGVVKKLFSPMKTLGGLIKDDLAGGFYGLTSGIGESITMWSKSLTAMDKFKVGLVGFLGLSMSMEGMASAMKSVSEEGWNLSNSLQTVISGLGGIASGAYIGSIFGPWGAVIGGATGAVLNLISAISGYETTSEKMIATSKNNLEIAEKNLQNYYDTKKAIEDSMNNELAQQEYNERLLSELDSLVDANGRVKQGYEDRANFILNELNTAYGTEYSIIDGTIDGYENLNDTIKKVIETKKAEIMLEAEKENYVNAIKNQTTAWKEYNEAIKEYNEINEKANELLNIKQDLESKLGTNAFKNYKYTSLLTGATYEGYYAYQAIEKDLETYNKTLEANMSTVEKTRQTFENYTNDIVFYENLQTAVLTENTEEQNRLIEDRLNSLLEANGEEKLSYDEQIKYYQDIANQKIKILKENGVEITEEIKKQADSQLNIVTQSLIEQTKTVENITPEIASAWATLGEENKNKFLESFGQLPENIQQKIVDKMQEKGYSISDELQKGINQLNPTVKIKTDTSQAKAQIKITADTSSAETKVNSLLGKIKSSLIGTSFGFFDGDGKLFANGGFPEDGLFFANHNELVGKFTNGKTAVANNMQIVEGIKAGVYEAVIAAMNQTGGQASSIDVHVHTDEGVVVDRINQKTKQTGVCPITIPVN